MQSTKFMMESLLNTKKEITKNVAYFFTTSGWLLLKPGFENSDFYLRKGIKKAVN